MLATSLEFSEDQLVCKQCFFLDDCGRLVLIPMYLGPQIGGLTCRIGDCGDIVEFKHLGCLQLSIYQDSVILEVLPVLCPKDMDAACQSAAALGITITAAAGDDGSTDGGKGNNVDF